LVHHSLLLCFISSKPSETTVLFIVADAAEWGGLFRDLEAAHEAGACCIQIENQVSDENQRGHQFNRPDEEQGLIYKAQVKLAGSTISIEG